MAERAQIAKAQAEKMAAERLAAQKAAEPKHGTVTARSLRIRKDHNTDAEVVAGLVAGNEVTIFETWTDGKNTWARVGPDQWSAMVYNGETFMKL